MLCAPWGGPGELIPAPMALGCVSPWSLPQQSGQAGPEHPSWLTEGPPVTGDGSWISAPSIRSSRGLLLGGEGMGDDESLPASSHLVHPHQDLKPVIDGMDGIKISQGLGLQDFDLIRVIGRGSYAKVLLVRLKKNDQVYAMKVVKKELVHDDEVRLHLFPLVQLPSCVQLCDTRPAARQASLSAPLRASTRTEQNVCFYRFPVCSLVTFSAFTVLGNHRYRPARDVSSP